MKQFFATKYGRQQSFDEKMLIFNNWNERLIECWEWKNKNIVDWCSEGIEIERISAEDDMCLVKVIGHEMIEFIALEKDIFKALYSDDSVCAREGKDGEFVARLYFPF